MTYNLDQYVWNDHNFRGVTETDPQSIASHIEAKIETDVEQFAIYNNCLFIPKGNYSTTIEKPGHLIKIRTVFDVYYFGWETITFKNLTNPLQIAEINFGWPLANAFVYTDQNDQISMSASIYNTGSTWTVAQGQPKQTDDVEYAAANGLYYTELYNYTANSKRLKVLTNAFLPTDDNWVLKNHTSENSPKFKYTFKTPDTIAKISGCGHRRWRTENINCIPLGSAPKEGTFDTTTQNKISWTVDGKTNSYTIPSGGKCVLIQRTVEELKSEDLSFNQPESDGNKRDSRGHMIWKNAHLLTPVLTENNNRWGRSVDRSGTGIAAWSAMSSLDSVLRVQKGQKYYDELDSNAQNAIDTANISLSCSYKWKEIAARSQFSSLGINTIDSLNQRISNFITPNPLFFYWHWTSSRETISIQITSKGKTCSSDWGTNGNPARPLAYIESGIVYNCNFNLYPWLEFQNDVNKPKITLSGYTETASTIRPCDFSTHTPAPRQNNLPEEFKNHGSMFSLSSIHGKLNVVGIPVPEKFFLEWYVGTTSRTRKFPIITTIGQYQVAQEIDVPWFGNKLEANTDWSKEWPKLENSVQGNWWFRDLTNGDGDLDLMYPYIDSNGNIGWVTNWFEIADNDTTSDTYGLYWVSDKIIVQAATSMPEFKNNASNWPAANSAWWNNWIDVITTEELPWDSAIDRCVPIIITSYSPNTNLRVEVEYDNESIAFWEQPEYQNDRWSITAPIYSLEIDPLHVYCIGVPCSTIRGETQIYITDLKTGIRTQYWSNLDLFTINASIDSWAEKFIKIQNASDVPQAIYIIQNNDFDKKYTGWELYKEDKTTLIDQAKQTVSLEPQQSYMLKVDNLGNAIISLYDAANSRLLNEFIYAVKFVPVYKHKTISWIPNPNMELSGDLQYWDYGQEDWVTIDLTAPKLNAFSNEYPLYIRGKQPPRHIESGEECYCRDQFTWNQEFLTGDNPTGVIRFNTNIDPWQYTSEERELFRVWVSGDLKALLDYRVKLHPQLKLANNAFYGLFAGNWSLANTPQLLDPTDSLSKGCYRYMFDNCGIRRVPALPHTELSEYCYQGMFANCSLLQSVPAINALYFPDGCCESMFGDAGVRYYEAGNPKNYRLPTNGSTGTFGTDALKYMFSNLQGNKIQTLQGNTQVCIVYQKSDDTYQAAEVITTGTGNGSSAPGSTPH